MKQTKTAQTNKGLPKVVRSLTIAQVVFACILLFIIIAASVFYIVVRALSNGTDEVIIFIVICFAVLCALASGAISIAQGILARKTDVTPKLSGKTFMIVAIVFGALTIAGIVIAASVVPGVIKVANSSGLKITDILILIGAFLAVICTIVNFVFSCIVLAKNKKK